MTCINCNNAVDGTFCNHCGQRLTVKRITFKEGWFDFWARIYGFDGMFPRTMRDLTLRPGVAAQKFIDGNRVLYYGPVGYFFLMITLFLLILSFMNMDFMDFMRGMQEYIPAQDKALKFQQKFQQFISDNLKIFVFLMIPFQALVAQKLYFRKSEKNFIEHSILPLYVMGHLYWLSIVSAVIYKITGSLIHGWFQPLVSILFFGFAYTTFITYQSKAKVFFKGMLIYLTAFVCFTTMLVVFMIGYIIYLAILDPETFNAIK
jgi:hypothetical protein